MLATIGYEKSTPEDFIITLREHEIDVLVDIRDRAQSRRPGFSKTALSLAANEADIEYVHIRALGDPKEGREAARAGMIKKFQRIFSKILTGKPAQAALIEVESLANSKRICLMCYERDHRCCHRHMVSEYLEVILGYKAVHLRVTKSDTEKSHTRRVFHTSQGATA